MCLRFHGYLQGCFARGAYYKIWDKHQFARATQSHRPRKASYIEHAFRVFMRTSTIYGFERIRIGRSERIKVTMLGTAAPGLTQLEVSLRLAGYIRRAVQQNGTAHVDAAFLGRFASTSGLPREFVTIAWQRVRRMPGLRVKWKGSGRGKKFVVSLPHFPTRPSSPSERRDRKSVSASPSDFPGENRGSPSSPGETVSEQPNRRALAFGATVRCPDPPFQVGERWISSKALLRLASWLAVGPMKDSHVRGWRVCWRFAHPRNLAYRALRDGHAAAAIVDAWELGVSRSHEDSLDRDRVPGGGFASEPREPSSAVVYAWQMLLRDKRPRETRWRELAAAAPRRLVFKPTRAAVSPAGAPAAVLTRRKSAEVIAELRAKIGMSNQPDGITNSGRNDKQLTATQLAEFLKTRGLTLGNFARMSWAMRQGYIRQARTAAGLDK